MSSAVQQGASIPTTTGSYSKQRLTISYHHPIQQQVITKNFLLSGGELMLFETILRHAYQIPSHEGIMLQLNDSVVVYPVSNLDVDEAGKAHKIEISTFLLPSAQSGGGMPPPISAPTPAPANPLLYNPGAVNIGNASKHVAPSLTERQPHHKISDEEGNRHAMKLGLGLGKLPPKAKKGSTAAAMAVHVPVTASVQMSDDDDDDNGPNGNGGNKEDKRKNNRGLDHRKSYLKEEKILVMLIKDTGKSAEEIASMTSVSKSNVEKWCSDKTREKIMNKYCTQPANRTVQQALLASNKLHFDVTNTSILYALIGFLFEKLRTLSSDSGIMLTNVAKLLNLPNNATFSKYLQAMPPSITPPSQTQTTSKTSSTHLPPSMPIPDSPMMDLNEEDWEDFVNPDAETGPVLKKKKEFDPHHHVASILYHMGTSGSNSPMSGSIPGSFIPKEIIEEDDEDDEDDIMQDLMAQVQAKRKDRLVTVRTFCSNKDKAPNGSANACGVSSSATAVVPFKSNYTSDITMQYNDNITWNMEALLSAASLMSGDLSGLVAGATPTDATAAASCPKTLQSTTSLQAKRLVLSNTKYVVTKRQEELKRLEAMKSKDAMDVDDSASTTSTSNQKKKLQQEKQ